MSMTVAQEDVGVVAGKPKPSTVHAARHPDESTLMSYAAGSLPEALSAVVACHLATCGSCREKVDEMEAMGAAVFSAIDEDNAAAEPAPVDVHPEIQAILAQANSGEQPAPSATATSAALKPESEAASIDAHSADPLVRLTGHTLDTVPWRRLGWGVWHYPIALKGERSGDLRLIKVQGGQAMPEHGHGGSELTLVLDGAYHDELGTFAAGDIADLDDDIEHRPVADSDMGCICLIASDRKARFTGVIGRLIQPITGM